MDEGVWGFAGDDDEGAALFELNVGNAANQVVGGTGGDSAQSTHSTWNYNQGVGGVGTRRIPVVVAVVWNKPLRQWQASLVRVDLARGVGEDDVHLKGSIMGRPGDLFQNLNHAAGVDLPRCTGHTYHNAAGGRTAARLTALYS